MDDDFGTPPSEDFQTPPSEDDFTATPVKKKPKHATTHRTPLSPSSPNMGKTPSGAQSDPRQFLSPSTGKSLYRGRIEAGSLCPINLANKLRTASRRAPVGIVRMLASTTGTADGLSATLRETQGLRGLRKLYVQLGGEMTINLDQGEDTTVLEATRGECNNGDANYHERVADPTKTAKVHHASQAAIKLSNSGTGVVENNVNGGGCSAHFDANGNKHCDLLCDYTLEQRKAMRDTALVTYEKVAETFPDAKVLLVHEFGKFKKRKHRGRDGMPVVTMEGVVAGRMVVLSVVSKHLSLAPGDTDAVLSIVDGRAALKVAGERALAWKKGDLDLGGLLENHTDADRKKAVLDFMGILVSAKQEPAEYREHLNADKTEKMVQMVDDLRKEPLEQALTRMEDIAKMWMPRGYTTQNRIDGGNNSNFGMTKGVTVEGARAEEAAAQENLDTASDDAERVAAKQALHEATKWRKLVETAREDQSTGGVTGDPDLKATGAGTGPGNVSGSTVPYAARLEGFPDIPLYCPTCEGDWRSFKGVKRNNNGQLGIPQGIVDDDNRVVFLRQERHWGWCGNCRCKPPEDATVTRNGVVYKVRSGQDGQFRKLA